eukprot:UN32452
MLCFVYLLVVIRLCYSGIWVRYDFFIVWFMLCWLSLFNNSNRIFFRLSNGDLPHIESKHLINTDLLGVVHMVPISMFAYACHSSILSIYNELKFPSHKRMLKVTRRGVFVCFGFYITTGVFGYMIFLEDTKDNILLNNWHNNPAMTIAQIALIFNMIFSVPIYVGVLRQ